MIDQPRPLACAVAISGLPDFRHPIAVDRPLPITGDRFGDLVKLESSRLCGMLKNPAKGAHSGQGSGKAAVIVIDLIAPALVIDGRKLVPPIAGRMRHDRMRAGIGSSIALDVPRVYIRQAEVNSIGFDKESGDHHLPRFVTGAVSYSTA